MSELRYFFRICSIIAVITLSAVALGSCSLAKNQITFDRAGEKDIQDYRDALAPQPVPEENADASIPDFQSVISTPADLQLPSPLVTVSVNQTVSLRDLMFELAEQAGIDLEMDPQIRGSIIFTAKERPFNDVVNRICEMAGLRYQFENDVLRIELDRPYAKNYKVDYMNIDRKSSSSIKTSIKSSGGGGTTSAEGGSDAEISSTYAGDYWKEIDEGLKQILLASDTYLSLATLADPVATVVAPPPPPMPVDANGNPIPGAVSPASTVPPSLNVSMGAPSEPLMPSAPATYSISKQTGIISVFASDRQHKLVQKFLDTIRHTTMTQILIEARVLEVTLNDEFSTGIDWGSIVDPATLTRSLIPNNVTGLATLGGFLLPPSFSTPSTNIFQAKFNFNKDLQVVASALSRFGTVRALSSPRVTVMNNQPAAVNVAENQVYFKVGATTTAATTTSAATTIYTAELQSAPVGVLLNVVPTANADTGEVILAVRPTVSKKIRDVVDPSIKLNSPDSDVQNLIPELSVQEIDSIIKMQSGQTMMMGGLMKDLNNVEQEGVPILGDVPVVGALFRNHKDRIQKSELVILLKATIVPGANADEMDRKLYREFGNDRRPQQL